MSPLVAGIYFFYLFNAAACITSERCHGVTMKQSTPTGANRRFALIQVACVGKSFVGVEIHTYVSGFGPASTYNTLMRYSNMFMCLALQKIINSNRRNIASQPPFCMFALHLHRVRSCVRFMRICAFVCITCQLSWPHTPMQTTLLQIHAQSRQYLRSALKDLFIPVRRAGFAGTDFRSDRKLLNKNVYFRDRIDLTVDFLRSMLNLFKETFIWNTLCVSRRTRAHFSTKIVVGVL